MRRSGLDSRPLVVLHLVGVDDLVQHVTATPAVLGRPPFADEATLRQPGPELATELDAPAEIFGLVVVLRPDRRRELGGEEGTESGPERFMFYRKFQRHDVSRESGGQAGCATFGSKASKRRGFSTRIWWSV